MSLDYRRLAFFAGAVVISAFAGWNGQPLVHESEDAASMITSVFSILAGFLMTVLTLLIEPKPTAKIWREAETLKFNFVNRLIRYKWLFMLYLIVLGLIFCTELISTNEKYSETVVWMERGYLTLTCLGFIISLTLPSQLMQLQVDRYNEMIEEKKKRSGRA